MPTVTACVIAKNEEAMLPRCLESIKGFCDEIILVDTGSTDRTMDIARGYGAKVFEHPWQNDFSFHRNQAFGYATSLWCLVIDCDEEIACDMSNFKERLARIPESVSALVVRVKECGDTAKMSWLGVRFFRRSANPHYTGIVHNKVHYKGRCAATDIVINHYGYSLAPEKMAAKRKRTETLLLARLEKDPKDFIAMYYMTQLRTGERNYKDVIEWGIKFFNTVTISPYEFEYLSVMYFWMAWAWLNLRDGGKAASWALKGLEFYPDDIDLNYIMARIGYEAKLDDWLRDYGKRYFELVEKRKAAEGQDNGEFKQEVNPVLFANRTVYCAEDIALSQIRALLEEAA